MTSPPSNILIVDDDAEVRKSLEEILNYKGYHCIEARDGKEALEKIENDSLDLVLLDLKLPRINGLEVLKQSVTIKPELPVVMISGHGTIQIAVEATKMGAYDFIEKPLEASRMLLTIGHAIEKRNLRLERDNLLKESRARYKMIGSDPNILKIFDRIDKASVVDSIVLITGESGTGKELAARAIHSLSSRAAYPFVPVNCAAIPESLIESELFGYTKGAFTGASIEHPGKFMQAHRGTLFLDEIGDMSLMMQAKVLRAIDNQAIDRLGSTKPIPLNVRIIAATNKDLKKEVDEGNFRHDLYYRLNVVPIYFPPLSERKGDIPALAEFFLDEICKSEGLPQKTFTQNAWPILKSHNWPGNIRELKNVIERVAVLSTDRLIDTHFLAEAMGTMRESQESNAIIQTLREARADFEKEFIRNALAASGGKIQETAVALGIQRTHLWKKMKLYSIEK